MAIVMREAELPGDREILLSVLLRNRDPSHNELRQARFEWSYFNNPYGPPRAWLAIDGASGKVVGAVGAFPRRVLVHGESLLCWNGGDTSIDRGYRTLGPAIKLRETVKRCVETGEMAFMYSYPVDTMRVVLERIGHIVIGNLPRYRLMLTLDRFFERFMGKHVLSSMLAKTINPLMLVWRGNFVQNKAFQVRLESERRFGSEYDRLFERVSSKHAVVAVRDSQFLTWRFLRNPLYRNIHVLRLQAAGRVSGYAVFEVANGTGKILDFLTEDDERGATLMLLRGVLRHLRRAGVHTLSLRAPDFSPLVQHLRAFGFVFPDPKNSLVVAYAGTSSMCRPMLEGRNWFMTEADRDV